MRASNEMRLLLAAEVLDDFGEVCRGEGLAIWEFGSAGVFGGHFGVRSEGWLLSVECHLFRFCF